MNLVGDFKFSLKEEKCLELLEMAGTSTSRITPLGADYDLVVLITTTINQGI